MKVIRVTKNDIATVDFIVANLIDNKEELTSTNHLQKLLTDDRSYLFAVLIDEEIIGYALAYIFPSLYKSNYLAYLYDIEVLVTFRRKGAGKFLMKTLLAHLKADAVSELWLGTATDNVEAQALFKSTGGIKSDETFNDFTYVLK